MRAILHGPADNISQVRYILSLGTYRSSLPAGFDEGGRITKFLRIEHLPGANLLAVLKEACSFIDYAMASSDGAVLVHCFSGIGRSPAVGTGYLMHTYDWDYETAFALVKGQWPRADPLLEFEDQLRLWYRISYSIHDCGGRDKAAYVVWKAKNEEVVNKRLEELEALAKDAEVYQADTPNANLHKDTSK